MIADKTLAVFATLALVAAAPAQEDAAAKKQPDPEILAKISTLEKAAKDRKFRRDQEAIGIVDELLAQYESLHEKSQAKFVTALGKNFKGKARKPENAALYVATAAALGQIGGPQATKVLIGAYKHKSFSKRKLWASLQDQLLEAVGKAKDYKQVKFLVDEASDSPHDAVKVAAGRALRHFEPAPFNVRKPIVKELVKAFARVHNGASQNLNQDPIVETHKRTLRAIADPWNETLAALTGETFRDARDWNRWWNKHKSSPKKWKHQTPNK